jgi:hypothetical protein
MPRPLYPRYPLDRKLGGPQSQSGRRGEEKILDPTGTRTPVVQPVASRYTDYAIQARSPRFKMGVGFESKAHANIHVEESQ